MSPFHSLLGSHTFLTLLPVCILPQMQIQIYLRSDEFDKKKKKAADSDYVTAAYQK